MKYLIKIASTALVVAMGANAPAAFVINEVDSDTPGSDALEFIELKGNPNESANGLILVLYDGAATGGPKSYRTIDLAGLTANADGYILIADNNVPNADLYLANGFVQNGEDAVGLYQDLATNFPNGTSPVTANLIDLLVYEANTQTDRDWSGFGTPTVYNEGAFNGVTAHSLSRIPDGSTGTWTAAASSPKEANSNQSFTISEVFLPRFNQATAVVPTTETITLRNTNTAPLTVSVFELATTSSAAFTTDSPADPATPVTLQYNQATSITVQFLETNASTNKSYTGVINYATDNPTSPSGSVLFTTELVRATQTAAVGAVKVNEICYNPGTVDHNGDGSTANQNDEYVELVNTTNAPIVIEGWEQRCKDFDAVTFHSFVFPAGATIPANGFVTVFTAGNPTGFLPGTTFTYGVPRIRNTGSLVGISDATKLVDGVAFLSAEETPDADGYANSGVSSVAGGSIGPRPDGSTTFRAFAPADPILTDRPTPNTTNNDLAGIEEWSLF